MDREAAHREKIERQEAALRQMELRTREGDRFEREKRARKTEREREKTA